MFAVFTAADRVHLRWTKLLAGPGKHRTAARSSGGGEVGYLENGTWHALANAKFGQITVRGAEAWLRLDALYRVATDGSGMKSYATACGVNARPVIAGPGDVWFAGAMDCHIQIP